MLLNMGELSPILKLRANILEQMLVETLSQPNQHPVEMNQFETKIETSVLTKCRSLTVENKRAVIHICSA